MINVRKMKALACMMAAGAAMLTACAPKEDENASVVNVEKGAAPAVWTPDGTPVTTAQEDLPGIVTVNPDERSSDAETADSLAKEAKKAPAE